MRVFDPERFIATAPVPVDEERFEQPVFDQNSVVTTMTARLRADRHFVKEETVLRFMSAFKHP